MLSEFIIFHKYNIPNYKIQHQTKRLDKYNLKVLFYI
jgi:hypothetical protein